MKISVYFTISTVIVDRFVPCTSLISSAVAGTFKSNATQMKENDVAITWTIAGSDSGGGAGIQADLLTINDLGSHGCCVITAITAQNSVGVKKIEYCSSDIIGSCIDSLSSDMPATAIKLGMLGSPAIISQISQYLENFNGFVVCDPVMISTSGSNLIEENAKSILVSSIFPKCNLITPNAHEAEALTAIPIQNASDMERAGQLLLETGAKSVYIKGGHFKESKHLSQDFFISATSKFWLSLPRIETDNTHGTGCTLSSAIAALLSIGYGIHDALVVAKAYVTEGISVARQIGKGPGPVSHNGFPSNHIFFPILTVNSHEAFIRPEFPSCDESIGLYPIVDSSQWVARLAELKVKNIQLRLKNLSEEELESEISAANIICLEKGCRLWVNDHWQLALKYSCYGVHVGQEDLQESGIFIIASKLSAANIRLGISTHCYEELSRALSINPSYISLGPIFETESKKVNFSSQGFDGVLKWRQIVPPHIPLVVIGGIHLASASALIKAGASGIAVISAITKAADIELTVQQWKALWY